MTPSPAPSFEDAAMRSVACLLVITLAATPIRASEQQGLDGLLLDSFTYRNLGPFSIDTVRVATEYIHNNPARRQLCASAAEWKWSSWRLAARSTRPKTAARAGQR
jgi:hypothetical protein